MSDFRGVGSSSPLRKKIYSYSARMFCMKALPWNYASTFCNHLGLFSQEGANIVETARVEVRQAALCIPIPTILIVVVVAFLLRRITASRVQTARKNASTCKNTTSHCIFGIWTIPESVTVLSAVSVPHCSISDVVIPHLSLSCTRATHEAASSYAPFSPSTSLGSDEEGRGATDSDIKEERQIPRSPLPCTALRVVSSYSSHAGLA